jgi:hypothetical protein
MAEVQEYKDLNELFCSVELGSFRELVEKAIDKAKDVLGKALDELDLLKETDKIAAGSFVYSKIIPLIVRLPDGPKQVMTKQISDRIKPLGITVWDLKKALGLVKPGAQEEPETVIEILDKTPNLISQPLAMIGDKVYAVTQVWVNEKTNEISIKEERKYIVSSEGEIYPISVAEKRFNVIVTLKEFPLPSHILSGKALNAFQRGYRADIASAFDRISEIYNRFIDFKLSYGSQEQMSRLCACTSLMTWYRLAIQALPYIWFNGEGGSGKSQAGEIWADTSFLGEMITDNSSVAAVRDSAGMGSSLMFDDAENITNPKDASKNDLKTLFLSGYRNGSFVKIKEKGSDDRFNSIVISTYCPKAFTAISIPGGAFGTRVIIVPLLKSIDTSRTNKDPGNIDLWLCNKEELRDDLWLCALQHLPEARSINNELGNEPELSGRDYERWRPVLMIARLLDRHGKTGIEAEIRDVMRLYYKDSSSTVTQDEKIPLIIEQIEKLFEDKPDNCEEIDFYAKLFTTELSVAAKEAGILTGEMSYSPRSIGKILNSLRLPNTHTKKGAHYHVTRKHVDYLRSAYIEKKLISDEPVIEGILTSPCHQSHNDEDISQHLQTSQCDHPNVTCTNPSTVTLLSLEPSEDDNGALPKVIPLLPAEEGCPF